MGVTDSIKKLYEREMTGANRDSTIVSLRSPTKGGRSSPPIILLRAPNNFRPPSLHAPPRAELNPMIFPVQNLLRAAGLFAGAIVVMRCFGDAFAI